MSERNPHINSVIGGPEDALAWEVVDLYDAGAMCGGLAFGLIGGIVPGVVPVFVPGFDPGFEPGFVPVLSG